VLAAVDAASAAPSAAATAAALSLDESAASAHLLQARVLAFKAKAPAPADGHVNSLKVLYSVNKGGSGGGGGGGGGGARAGGKSTRHIPSAPERILDAPELQVRKREGRWGGGLWAWGRRWSPAHSAWGRRWSPSHSARCL
jgi:cell division cycle protein 20 (cofactor of APC complex)